MKNKILPILFCIFIFGFCLLNIFIPDNKLSYSERRHLTELPEHSFKNIIDGSFFDNFEEYATDQFVLRDYFRKFKVFINFNIFKKKDYNNLYIKDNYIYKIDYPLNNNSVENFSKKINYIYDTYLSKMNVYYSIIPDKNYYNDDKYLKIDYDKLIDIVKNNVSSSIKYIDITKDLDINSYYYTDIHWRQECLDNVIKTLSRNMNFNYTNNNYPITFSPFLGSYYGQIGISHITDEIIYNVNSTINNSSVKDIDNNINPIYQLDKLGKMDSYDVFLGGATPFIEVTTDSNSSRELVIFRDSFASSLAPLLTQGYKKITLIDLRYMDADLISKYIEFNNQDILFLYNTTIINNSNIIKVNYKK